MKWKRNPSFILPAHSLFFGRTGSARPLKRQRAHQILGSSMTSDFSWFFKSYFSWKALVLMDKIYGYWYDHGVQNILIMYVCIYIYIRTEIEIVNIPWEPTRPSFFWVISPIYWGLKKLRVFQSPLPYWVRSRARHSLERATALWRKVRRFAQCESRLNWAVVWVI